ncbi:MAG: LUD domain-containing protein, partial [Desulfobulbaceae bacterium]|nr:LUD domain-containing protein [Desulfobulbaceae bacterium]
RMATLDQLDRVLAQLAEGVRARGGQVFFAATAEEANEYVLALARKHAVQRVVKGKSMLSAEIGIDTALSAAGIEVVETDLGEYIVQLAGSTASHIIAPCIHMDRQQIGRLFAERLGIPYTDDPPTLTRAARKALREKLLTADMGLTGCNIACAETGQISLVSNEGNIRMATTMPKLHVALMGMERVAATLEDQRELLQLLTQGAALQKLSTYVSFVGGPRRAGDPDGPDEFHLVIVDNGRSRILADPEFREVLACIRCGACLNICPVYGRIGGHAYGSPYSGPIGAVVTPLLKGVNLHADLCKGETLCGACRDVCPVENDLPRMLLALRHKLAYGDPGWQVRPHNRLEGVGFKLWQRLIDRPSLYAAVLRLLGGLQRPFTGPEGLIGRLPGWSGWTEARDLVPLAATSFRERWRTLHRHHRPDRVVMGQGVSVGSTQESLVPEPLRSGLDLVKEPALQPTWEALIASTDDEATLRTIASRSREDQLDLLRQLHDNAGVLGLKIHTCAALTAAAACIAAIARESAPEFSVTREIVCHDHPLLQALQLEHLLAGEITVHLTRQGDSEIRQHTQDSYIGVTAPAWGIAESATLVQLTRPGQPRSTSLVPSIHIAVLSLSRLVATLAEAYALIRREPKVDSLVFISGPSKTADIEACMVLGAHGPRAMHLIVVTEASADGPAV